MDSAHKQLTKPSLELFQRSSLSLPVGENKLHRHKKRDRPIKPKSAGSKPKGRPVLSSRKALENKENTGPLSLSTKLHKQEKLSVWCNAKSSNVAKRKLLGASQTALIQPTASSGNDLKRVLGHSPSVKQTDTQPSTVSPVQTSSSPNIPMRSICANLSEGLKTDEIFPGSWYLESTKAEIKKIMKQSNPEWYGQLKACFSASMSESGTLMNHLIEGTHPEEPTAADEFVLQGQSFPLPVDPLSVLFALPYTDETVAMNTEIDSSPYHIDSLQLNSTLSPPPPDMHDDFLDTMDNSPNTYVSIEKGNWGMSPVKRFKLFPQKLY